MIEESLKLNQKTKDEIEEARKQIKAGKLVSHEQVKMMYGL